MGRKVKSILLSVGGYHHDRSRSERMGLSSEPRVETHCPVLSNHVGSYLGCYPFKTGALALLHTSRQRLMAAARCFFSFRPSVAHQCEPVCRPLSLRHRCVASYPDCILHLQQQLSKCLLFFNPPFMFLCSYAVIRSSRVRFRSRANAWADFIT